jgi:uncharacterized metal-binding protein
MATRTSLESALKRTDRIVREYVIDLKRQNAKLQREVAKLEAERVTARNRITALERQLKKGPFHNIKVSFVKPKNDKAA